MISFWKHSSNTELRNAAKSPYQSDSRLSKPQLNIDPKWKEIGVKSKLLTFDPVAGRVKGFAPRRRRGGKSGCFPVKGFASRGLGGLP